MANNIYTAGLQNVGSYQVSGRPFITGSNIYSNENAIASGDETSVSFPAVTKSITLWNYSADPLSKLRLTFVATGSINNHPASGVYYELGQNESLTLSLKCKDVYLSAVSGEVLWKLYASLTSIAPERMYALTGSGISE
jgi:hypothetical protein